MKKSLQSYGILFSILGLFYFLGLTFNIDFIIPFMIKENGFSVSFIGIILFILTSFLVAYVSGMIENRKRKK